MGKVLSQSQGFTYFSAQCWGFLIFHTVAMGLGLLFFDFAVKGKREAQSSKQ
jgi:uncharacterized membrane protein